MTYLTTLLEDTEEYPLQLHPEGLPIWNDIYIDYGMVL